jgi:phage terminase large subunit GpA-like protein
MVNFLGYIPQLEDVLEWARVKISSIKPSEWTESKIIMPKPFPGPFRYDKTPYMRKIIDCFAVDHPAREIVLMGGAQLGKSTGVINPVVGWIIENDPSNIIMTIGNEKLLEQAMVKIDHVIDSAGIRHLIKSNAKRAKSQRTGDTNTSKEFPGGFFRITPASVPSEIRQESYKYGLFDDYDAMKRKTKSDGSHRRLLLKRFTTFATSFKILWTSTPTIKGHSNVEEVYLMGDQEVYEIPCPCCGVFIPLEWSITKDDGTTAGITWQLDNDGKLIEESVGYTCQECGGFFDDKNKADFVMKGVWRATAIPQRPDIYSFHINSLYSPHGMTDWKGYVYEWLEAHPAEGQRDEEKYQTFLNLNLGLSYEPRKETTEAKNIQKNAHDYKIGTIPEKISVGHGNGRIVMLTCGADMNGKILGVNSSTVNDARLDYQVIAWTESGSQYSILHGSIGTFIPNESGKRFKEDRVMWSYNWADKNNVWDEFLKVLHHTYTTEDGRPMKIVGLGLDEGYGQMYARDFITRCNVPFAFTVKGQSADNRFNPHIDRSIYKKGLNADKLYVLNIGLIKDSIAESMLLKYDPKFHTEQPSGFLNFPYASDGLYQYHNFYSHYEAEERKILETKDGSGVMFRWEKKANNPQNHQWDCHVYNVGMKEIICDLVCKEAKIQNHNWSDFVRLMSMVQ